MEHLKEPAPGSFQRWVASHARVLFAVLAVLTAVAGWRLVGALRSPDTHDVVASALITLAWTCLTLQVPVTARWVARYDHRATNLGFSPGGESGPSGAE